MNNDLGAARIRQSTSSLMGDGMVAVERETKGYHVISRRTLALEELVGAVAEFERRCFESALPIA